MNNIVKSVVFAAVVLFAGIAAMQVIYKNQDGSADITAVEPAAGDAVVTPTEAQADAAKDTIDANAEAAKDAVEANEDAAKAAIDAEADAAKEKVDAAEEAAEKAAE